MTDAVLTTDGKASTAGVHTDALRQKAVAAGQAVVELAGEARHVATAGAAELAGHAREWASSKGEHIRNRAESVHVSTISYVRHNPYKSLAISAGIGVMVGMMLRFRGGRD